MALSAQTVQYISQLGLLTYVDPSQGPKGPHGTVVYKLVPTNEWFNGHRFPAEVALELKAQGFSKYVLEGIKYYLVPDDSATNVPGTLSHYAQRTSTADLQNPSYGFGVNRSAETFDKTADHTVSPEAVSRYVSENDNWELARREEKELNERVKRQIGHA